MRRREAIRRRDRLRELAIRDWANRCTVCRGELKNPIVQIAGDPRKFCSQDCYLTHLEREALGC